MNLFEEDDFDSGDDFQESDETVGVLEEDDDESGVEEAEEPDDEDEE